MEDFKPYLYYEPVNKILSTDPIKDFKYKFEVKKGDDKNWKTLYKGNDHFIQINKPISFNIVRVHYIPNKENKTKCNFLPSNEIRISDYNNF